VVVCQFGTMFFPDKVQGYREALRVLRPGGTFVFSVWDQIAENHFVKVVSQALTRVFPDDPPTFMARIPHGFHDTTVIGHDLVTAGFSSCAVETLDHMAKAANGRAAAMAYCQGTPLRAEIEARDASRLEEAVQSSADALVREFGDGPIEGRIRAHIISAAH
jgi:SAM-dependent methyltransferase